VSSDSKKIKGNGKKSNRKAKKQSWMSMMRNRYSSFMNKIFNRKSRDELEVSVMTPEMQEKIEARKEKYKKMIEKRRAKLAARKAAKAKGTDDADADKKKAEKAARWEAYKAKVKAMREKKSKGSKGKKSRAGRKSRGGKKYKNAYKKNNGKD
jgi:hypothetical protein